MATAKNNGNGFTITLKNGGTLTVKSRKIAGLVTVALQAVGE
jgi:hypothetical protein